MRKLFWIKSGCEEALQDVPACRYLPEMVGPNHTFRSPADIMNQENQLNQLQGFFLNWCSPISVPKRKPAKQPITAFLSIRIYRNSTSDWLAGSFLFGTEIGEHQLKKKHPVSHEKKLSSEKKLSCEKRLLCEKKLSGQKKLSSGKKKLKQL